MTARKTKGTVRRKGQTWLTATRRNMRAVGHNCFVYSFETLEQYSANPADYFMSSDDEDRALRDSDGRPMVLARTRQIIYPAMPGKGQE